MKWSKLSLYIKSYKKTWVWFLKGWFGFFSVQDDLLFHEIPLCCDKYVHIFSPRKDKKWDSQKIYIKDLKHIPKAFLILLIFFFKKIGKVCHMFKTYLEWSIKKLRLIFHFHISMIFLNDICPNKHFICNIEACYYLQKKTFYNCLKKNMHFFIFHFIWFSGILHYLIDSLSNVSQAIS